MERIDVQAPLNYELRLAPSKMLSGLIQTCKSLTSALRGLERGTMNERDRGEYLRPPSSRGDEITEIHSRSAKTFLGASYAQGWICLYLGM